ncbi:MAG: hypothetical protein ACRCTG_16640 [Aestuariivirga sp.]
MLGIQTKQPADHLDYDISFEDWLPEDDFVQAATSSVDVAGLTITDTLVMSPLVKVWLSGGVDGSTYKITVTATTNQGRVKETEFKLRVRNF